MAATKEKATISVEEELAVARRRIAELEARGAIAAAATPTKPERRAAIRPDGTGGEVIQDVTEWLNQGCPLCHQPIHTDTPVYVAGKAGLYPALLFHYGVWHEGVTPPPAPHPADEAELDALIVVGNEMVGANTVPRKVVYRQFIADAIVAWKRGVR